MSTPVIGPVLIRHGEVHRRWRGVCYGASDVGLSPRGRAQHRRLADRLARWSVRQVVSSDLRRTRHLAVAIAERHDLEPTFEPALRERDFGAWERRDWQTIYEETGAAMDGMIDAPRTWRPPAGETTYAMRDRVVDCFDRLASRGGLVVVTHGGPIAALRGTRLGLAVREWPALVPPWGSLVPLDGESP
ncbi:MAG: histidine phosphatase family protein [Acidobacteriota bacterium]